MRRRGGAIRHSCVTPIVIPAPGVSSCAPTRKASARRARMSRHRPALSMFSSPGRAGRNDARVLDSGARRTSRNSRHAIRSVCTRGLVVGATTALRPSRPSCASGPTRFSSASVSLLTGCLKRRAAGRCRRQGGDSHPFTPIEHAFPLRFRASMPDPEASDMRDAWRGSFVLS